MGDEPDDKMRDFWGQIGKSVGIALAVVGFVVLGVMVFFYFALNSWANSK